MSIYHQIELLFGYSKAFYMKFHNVIVDCCPEQNQVGMMRGSSSMMTAVEFHSEAGGFR